MGAQFSWNPGTGVIDAVVQSTPTVEYCLYGDAPPDFPESCDTAVGSSLNLQVVNLTGLQPGETFLSYVYFSFASGGDQVAVIVFQEGTSTPYSLGETWAFNGTAQIAVTFPSLLGVDYWLVVQNATPVTDVGTGGLLTLTVTDHTPGAAPNFLASLYADMGNPSLTGVAGRIFDDGVAGAGYDGVVEAVTNPAVPVIQGALWRFIVTTLDTETLTVLDRLAEDRTVLAQLNGPWQHDGTVPSDNPEVNIPHDDGDPFLAEGNRLIYGFRREGGAGTYEDPIWKCRFAGVVLSVADDGSQDPPRTAYTAYDPWQYLYSRPVLNPETGLPLGPDGYTWLVTPASTIALTALTDSMQTDPFVDVNGVAFIDAGLAWLGTADWAGTIETTLPIDKLNIQQGTTVGDLWDDLVATGTIDIVLTPVYDPLNRPGVLVDLSIYIKAGIDRDGAIMAWDKPSRSLVGLNRALDGTQRGNKIRYHYGPGGPALTDDRVDAVSKAKYREYYLEQFFPDQNRRATVEAMADTALSIVASGQQTYEVSPAPERSPLALLEYTVGDHVPVYASRNLRQEMMGMFRVLQIPITIRDDSVEMVERALVVPYFPPPQVLELLGSNSLMLPGGTDRRRVGTMARYTDQKLGT